MNSSKLKVMQIMLSAFCIGIITFAMVSLLLNKDKVYFDTSIADDQTGFYPLFPLFGLAAIIFGRFMFNKQLGNLPEGAGLDEKIAGYQTAFIIRSAFLEGASLMNIVGFLISANAVFLIVPAIAVAVLILTRPTKQGVTDTLNLSYPDTEKL
ncbi:MAG: hypothetical protein P0Y49_21570 [Candidatus Pedobacter colombiensis]|uniref:Uncharacterized protein n=1 Tax=Candidatus Pedobacter colombiensis TaxID=3121371 RepID=A0AAJ6B8P8_9SPHI|nr:hypothetical protein [Pedobacter sp.]WEK19368.1 MAG: hypothetical protein P0Y49_21570 [Pedobacter sp.]